MATLKDIANRAGVSQGAVSRILNNDVTFSVSNETRENVIRVANELGYKLGAQRYKKSELTKSLSGAPEIRIGIAQMYEMQELQEDIYYLVMHNILEKQCSLNGWTAVHLMRDKNNHFVKVDDRPLDGIIAIGRFDMDEIADFRRYTKSVVFIDSSPDEMTYFSIVPNYHLAVRHALNHFFENGYDEVAYVGAVKTYNSVKEMEMDPRYYYYRNTLDIRGTFDDSLVIDCLNNSGSSYEAMSEYLNKKRRPPKAMFISSDAAAAGVLKAVQERGFSIPGDTSIVTYNNTAFSSSSNPPLDSIEVYIEEVVISSIWCMQQLFAGAHPKKMVVPCELITRGSVTYKL